MKFSYHTDNTWYVVRQTQGGAGEGTVNVLDQLTLLRGEEVTIFTEHYEYSY